MLSPASFKLALMCCSCMHHLLPWVASYSLVMHHTWLIILSCYVLCVYHVVCFFPAVLLLDSSCFVAILRIHSSTWLRLLHGLDLIPSGISGKMTVTLDLTTIFAMLVVSMLSVCRATYHLFIKPPKLSWLASTLFTLPSKPLFGYVTTLISRSYSLASCRCRLFHARAWIFWDITISLILTNAHIYLVKGGRLGLMPRVLFHSCHPSFCHTGVMFLDFASLTWWGFMGPSWQFALNKTLPARLNIGFNICHNNN